MDISAKSMETCRRRYALAGRMWKGHLLEEVCAMGG